MVDQKDLVGQSSKSDVLWGLRHAVCLAIIDVHSECVSILSCFFAVGHREATWVTVGVLWITRSFSLHDVSHHIQLRSERDLSSRHDAGHFLGLGG
jgi:hypothetical protein